MEALRDYCEPRQVLLTLFALEGSESFFWRFSWLTASRQGDRNLRSTWPSADS
jgi:hypothetical protein